MDYKKEADILFNELLNFSNNSLNMPEDIRRIIETSLQHNEIKTLEKISFAAKYTQGLLKIIRNKSNEIDDQYFSKIQDEYSENIQKVKEYLIKLADYQGNFLKNIYNEKFFTLTQKSLQNLNYLCSDLSRLKSLLNDKKRND